MNLTGGALIVGGDRWRFKEEEMPTINNGFYQLPADERTAAYDYAREKYGVDNFFDLEPEERAEIYEKFGDERD